MRKVLGAKLATAILAAVLLAAGCSESTPGVLTLTPAGMNPTGKFTVDPAGVVAFWGNGALQSKVHAEKGPVTITINAWGHTVDGEAPILLADLEARVVGKLVIDSDKPKDYVINTGAQHAGTTIFGLTFSNHADKPPNALAGRWLVVKSVTIEQK
ncbi:MAG: hypothetical protein HYR72_14125 [Deltaproteobacteria bacterium]|nr:hypothetical protein [Deltaproteobacteria bacterium]MBI3391482.1 hypothetical protein [Deltaproteobacteria bacterium]